MLYLKHLHNVDKSHNII